MHFHMPKPVHGWRDFVGEVGIIVLGVMIALGAEQALEAWHWRGEVRDFKEAVDQELDSDVNVFRDRVDQTPCLLRRLDQLEKWGTAWETGGQPLLKTKIGRPSYLSPQTNVWASRTTDVVSHLSLKDRLAYAALYDSVSSYNINRAAEGAVWVQIQGFSHVRRLDDEEVARLRSLIDQARESNAFFVGNFGTFTKKAESLGLRARSDPDAMDWDHGFCNPLRWAGQEPSK